MKLEDTRPPAYYPWFDSLRIVLASVVMLGHDKILPFWPKAPSFAVEVFFALSGWLIGGILLKTEVAGLPRFFFNRAVRIWIPYAIALALLLGVGLLRDPITSKWIEIALYKLTFVYNLFGTPQIIDFHAQMPLKGSGSHFWSVNAEEQFYLAAPLLLVVMVGLGQYWGRSAWLWLTLCALSWYFNLYPSIVFGVTAAVISQLLPDWQLRARAQILLIAGLCLGTILYAKGIAYEITVPFCAISIVMLLARPGTENAIGKFLGGISYPLYLNHWIGVFAANAVLSPVGLRDSPARQLLAVLLNLAVAACLYWFIDRKLLATRASIYTPVIGKCTMVAAYLTILLGCVIAFTYRTFT